MLNDNEINIEQRIYEIFSRRYSIVGLLGAGGMGCVFYGKSNDSLEIERAIKVLDKRGYNKNLDILAEAYALKNLDHPNIPKVIEITEDEDFVFIVQEYVKGDSFKQIFKNNEKVSEKLLIFWMETLAKTLNYLHNQGVIHRDIKPDNIMLTPEGQVKIIDFGLARNRSEVDEVDEKVIGTLSYTAPERFLKQSATIQTDIYGYGTTLYTLATGKKPESMKKNPRRSFNIMKGNLKKHASPGIAYILMKTIAIDPNKRYYNFESIIFDIKKIEPFNKSLKKQKINERIIFVFLFLGLIASSASIIQGMHVLKIEKEEKYATLVENGTQLLENGKTNEAIEVFENSITLLPKTIAAHQGVMEVYTKTAEYEKVIDYGIQLKNKIEETKDSAEIQYLIGNAYHELNKFNEAIPYLKEGVELDPSVEHNLILGVNYCGLEEFDKAQEVVETFKVNVENTDAANYLSAQIFERQGNNDGAKSQYYTVLENSTKQNLRRRAYLALGRLNKNEKNYQAMITDLEKYQVELGEKDDPVALELLGEAYFAQGKNGDSSYLEKSKVAFEKLLELGYTRSYLYRNIAIINQEEGDLYAALEVLEEMNNEYPEDYTSDIQKVWILIQIENIKENKNRNYQEVKNAYEKLMTKAEENINDPEIQMLTEKINEIRAKGW